MVREGCVDNVKMQIVAILFSLFFDKFLPDQLLILCVYCIDRITHKMSFMTLVSIRERQLACFGTRQKH